MARVASGKGRNGRDGRKGGRMAGLAGMTGMPETVGIGMATITTIVGIAVIGMLVIVAMEQIPPSNARQMQRLVGELLT